MVNPLAELRPDKLYLTKVEDIHNGPGSEYTLFDQDGPGNVVNFWMALGNAGTPLDGRVRVYYDGADTPSVDIDFGTLLATHWGAGGHEGSHSSTHVHVEIDSHTLFTGFLVTFPMPFGQHIRITHYNPTGDEAWGYSMVTYSRTSTDEANGMRLRCQGARWADQAVTRQPGDVTTLADIQGGPGWVVHFSQVGGVDTQVITPGSPNLDSWLERNFSFRVDGETDPSIETSGTEDTFDSAWYYNGWQDYNTSRHSYVGTDRPANQPHAVGMSTDLWSKWGGVRFENSLAMRAETESVCTTGDRFCWCVLYYQ